MLRSTKKYNGDISKIKNSFKIIFIIFFKTRMTTFIKTKFKKTDDQTNIDKYRVAEKLQNIKYLYQESSHLVINRQDNSNMPK